MTYTIREYAPPADTPAVLACIVELQDFERAIDPALPPGADMAEAYLAYILQHGAESDGRIFVAEVEGGVSGYVSVWARTTSSSPDGSREPYAYVSDLVVMPEVRGRGIGRALLARAEEFARREGATTLRIGVLAENKAARALYIDVGFVERGVSLTKRIAAV